jgi:hypothetical protein
VNLNGVTGGIALNILNLGASFTPRKRASDTHLIGDWADPTASLNVVAKQKKSPLLSGIKPQLPQLSVVTTQTELLLL